MKKRKPMPAAIRDNELGSGVVTLTSSTNSWEFGELDKTMVKSPGGMREPL